MRLRRAGLRSPANLGTGMGLSSNDHRFTERKDLLDELAMILYREIDEPLWPGERSPRRWGRGGLP